MDDALGTIADQIRMRYGMSRDAMMAHLVMGDMPHWAADSSECGAMDPRDEAYWCHRPKGHATDHNRYRQDEDWI